jgi:acid phosphatase (class A)
VILIRNFAIFPHVLFKNKIMKSGLLKKFFASKTILCGAIALSIFTSAFADELKYFTPGHLDGIALLTPPPAPGSAEQAADLASARAVFRARTEAEKERAFRDANISLFNFAPIIGPVFQPGKLPKTEALFEQVKKDIKDAINTPKNFYKRKRPYQVDPTLDLGKPEPSYSYPSGHSTRGMLQALMLAEIFPEKRDAILEFGRTIGWDRVLIGKHFPTDVVAGRVLAQAIMRELMSNPEFQKAIAEAKAEAQAAEKEIASQQATAK